MLNAEDVARYARQIMLAEVGRAGQAGVALASAAVAAPAELGPSAPLRYRLASRYARRAGFGALTEARLELAQLAPVALVTQPAAREVLAGCRAAVVALRAAVRSGAPTAD